ncbi:hypothetical protein Bca52824_074063 [Brassica carinata]|uniref:Uncharacterized protein n=1 Tax=Brassica carinata TaxID=52824 RepID=A0A8X7U6F3_BRACI|nr:hypothetical protein Bca52824_074063 [Brassica carinata]
MVISGLQLVISQIFKNQRDVRRFLDVLSENAEEDNQIGDKEEKGPVTLEMDKEQGARMMLFKSQNVAAGTMKKRMVQGLVSPRKRPSAKAGIRQGDGFKKVEETVPQTLYRAHQNPDFMDRSFEEEKLWWQILREQMSRGYYRWCPNGEWEFNCGVSLVTINYQRKDRECRGYGVNNQTQGCIAQQS